VDRAPATYRVRARNIDPAAENKIHDDEVARRFGFAGALVPGVELFAYLTHPLVAAWGPEWLTGGCLDVRFRRPVYDGEQVLVEAEPAGDGSYGLTLSGVDGTTRATAQARAPVAQTAADTRRYVVVPLPVDPPPAGPDTLRPGPLGTVEEVVDLETNARYLAAVAESLDLYRDEGVVHPGLLLRLVNALLFRNVVLGPWVHSASRCRLLAAARVPASLSARGVVTDRYERNGHAWVRYDALVLSGDTPVLEVDHTAIYALAEAPH
jgi:hypothetical protein